MTSVEQTDILVIGSGFGGAIAAYHLSILVRLTPRAVPGRRAARE